MAERPTLRQVAARAGVSMGTASGVLSRKGSASAETRALVLAAAAELGYRPRSAATGGRLTTVGILARSAHYPSPGNPFYMPVLHGAQRACAELDISLVYELVEHTGSRAAELPLVVRRRQVEGLLVLGYLETSYLRWLLEVGPPLVLVDHWVADLPIDTVRDQDEHGGYLAARHLLDLGHLAPPPAVIAGMPQLVPIQERLAGYRRALTERGLRAPAGYVQHCDQLDVDGGVRAMSALLDLPTPPTAVFCCNDSTALGALDALRRRGLAVPGDCSVVGYDDIDTAAHSAPPLTTVGVDKELLGAQAIWQLTQRVRAPGMTRRDTRLDVRLVLRQSAGVRRPSSAAAEAGHTAH